MVLSKAWEKYGMIIWFVFLYFFPLGLRIGFQPRVPLALCSWQCSGYNCTSGNKTRADICNASTFKPLLSLQPEFDLSWKCWAQICSHLFPLHSCGSWTSVFILTKEEIFSSFITLTFANVVFIVTIGAFPFSTCKNDTTISLLYCESSVDWGWKAVELCWSFCDLPFHNTHLYLHEPSPLSPVKKFTRGRKFLLLQRHEMWTTSMQSFQDLLQK